MTASKRLDSLGHGELFFFPTLLLALLYFITGRVALDILSSDTIVTAGMFPPEGIALAFVLHYGKRVWPGIFLGQLLLALSGDLPPFAAISIAAINSAEALLGLWAVRRFRVSLDFRSVGGTLGFALTVLLLLQPFSALLSNLVLWMSSSIPEGTFGESLFWWWFGNASAQLLITPFLLRCVFVPERRGELLGSCLVYGTLFAIYVYLLEGALSLQNPFLLYILTIPPLILVVARKGIGHGLAFGMATALVTFYGLYRGFGPFLTENPLINTINFNLYLLAYTATILTVGPLFEERRGFERVLKDRINASLKKNREQQMQLYRQRRLSQMGELLSMIAHQWRQPLNNLSLINQQLKIRFRRGNIDAQAVEEMIDRADRQIRLMSETIDDFRDFFRGEEPQEYALAPVIRKTLKAIEPTCEANGIRLTLEVPEHLTLYGTPNALIQALLNILNNANDILKNRETSRRWIEVKVTESVSEIQIRICDSGGGIPPEVMGRIFDPYYSTKDRKNGTGLGLYMSRMIIEEQPGGAIHVENGTEGACFVIHLGRPMKRPSAPEESGG